MEGISKHVDRVFWGWHFVLDNLFLRKFYFKDSRAHLNNQEIRGNVIAKGHELVKKHCSGGNFEEEINILGMSQKRKRRKKELKPI